MQTHSLETPPIHPPIAQERALAELRILARDSEDLLIATAHDTSDRVIAARSRVSLAVDRAKDTMIELEDQVLTAAQKGENLVRKHLLEFVGVAFGLGLLVGALVIGVSRRAEHST